MLLFYYVQELTTFSEVFTCLNYLYMPCVLIIVKPNDTYLYLLISFFFTLLLLASVESYFYSYGLFDDKVTRIRSKNWQCCCCWAVQRWTWHDTAPLALFLITAQSYSTFLSHSHPSLATLPLRLCLSHSWSVALNFVFILISSLFNSHPLELLLILFHVTATRNFY